MLIHIGFELIFDLPAPVSMLLLLHTHPQQAPALQKPEYLMVEPAIPVHTFIDRFGNRASRIHAPAGRLRLAYDNVIHDSGLPEPSIDGARLHPTDELPDECLPFLLSSRYCEVDRLSDTAWNLFGQTPPTWERVQAVMDWVHGNVTFGYEFARPTKTAYDVCSERQGVCRDFMHLAITMLRALNIPARYATGYLGDIGVPIAPFPMDFSAWMEVYLGNRWFTLDARHNEPRIGRILQARGRDAVDVALTTSFGSAKLESFTVWTDEIQHQNRA
jgi:transglutaminase-like putative cysteine protease